MFSPKVSDLLVLLWTSCNIAGIAAYGPCIAAHCMRDITPKEWCDTRVPAYSVPDMRQFFLDIKYFMRFIYGSVPLISTELN